MSHTSSVKNLNKQNYVCDSQEIKKGVYGTAVTLVALAVIFGALILITEHCGLNWGSLNEPIQNLVRSLGQYTFVPLVTSTSLLVVLIVGGIFCKKYQPIDKKFEKGKEEVPSPYNLEKQLRNAAKRGETDNIRKALIEGRVTNHTQLLEDAALYGHRDLVKLLQKNGANPQNSDSNFSAIHHATRCWEDANKAIETMTFLLQKDPKSANAKTKKGLLTPLHLAARSDVGPLEKIQLLIGCGAEINAQDSSGNTPLHCTILPQEPPNIEVIEFLMEKGALLIKNNEGKTFVELAQEEHPDWLANQKDRLEKCGISLNTLN